MKLLVDAQLPRRLVYRLREAGHDALHTLDLPDGNRTPDDVVNHIAEREDRVVVTKDADFVASHLVHGRPRKLLLVSTGNIRNAALEKLLVANLDSVMAALETSDFVELTSASLIVHA